MPVKVVPRSLTETYKKREGDFSPNLVGFQATKAPLYTLGNFAVTTNLEGKLTKDFNLGGEWSDYYSLDNLSLSEEESKLLESNQFMVDLNFDITKISRYAHFGSLTEFIRVNVEQIITNWKGSLYVNKNLEDPILNTVLTYSFDSSTNLSSFRIPVIAIVNNFELKFEDNDDFSTVTGDISNLTNSFNKYFLWNDYGSFIITDYTGSDVDDQYLTVEVYGEAWPQLTGSTFDAETYHIRPIPNETEKFFLGLTDFQKVMLNRLDTPKYTFELEIPQETDNGGIVREKQRFSWPFTDKYNLDINGGTYGVFLDNLFNAANQYDRVNSDLISRKYTTVALHEYDTPGEGSNETGQKVQKLLRIYGREFDDIKKYVDGISFANVVTYDKRDNTSDDLIKFMAKTLGLDTLETVFGDDFNIMGYNSANEVSPTFSAYSREFTPKEIEVEFWRRLVINAWWLWKSKGTRKVLEFFLKLFGVHDEVIDLDEYIYLASGRLDTADIMEQIEDYFDRIGEPQEVSISDYPLTELGYPKPLPNTEDNYFQMKGGWYNGGTEITEGNNPHFGPYDFGSSYFKTFSEFVPNQITSFTGESFVRAFDLFEGNEYGNLVVGFDDIIFIKSDTTSQIPDSLGAIKYDITTNICDPIFECEPHQIVNSTNDGCDDRCPGDNNNWNGSGCVECAVNENWDPTTLGCVINSCIDPNKVLVNGICVTRPCGTLTLSLNEDIVPPVVVPPPPLFLVENGSDVLYQSDESYDIYEAAGNNNNTWYTKAQTEGVDAFKVGYIDKPYKRYDGDDSDEWAGERFTFDTIIEGYPSSTHKDDNPGGNCSACVTLPTGVVTGQKNRIVRFSYNKDVEKFRGDDNDVYGTNNSQDKKYYSVAWLPRNNLNLLGADGQSLIFEGIYDKLVKVTIKLLVRLDKVPLGKHRNSDFTLGKNAPLLPGRNVGFFSIRMRTTTNFDGDLTSDSSYDKYRNRVTSTVDGKITNNLDMGGRFTYEFKESDYKKVKTFIVTKIYHIDHFKPSNNGANDRAVTRWAYDTTTNPIKVYGGHHTVLPSMISDITDSGFTDQAAEVNGVRLPGAFTILKGSSIKGEIIGSASSIQS